MAGSVSERIIEEHLVEGEMESGREIGIRIDQTLTQDATGTLVYLELEATKVPRALTELSVSYVDHNVLQTDHRSAEDQRYLQTVAARYGVHFSKPGNGVSHQVHMERFGAPGKTLLGSDSHTPTAGCLGMLGIGAGGLDVALAMAGEPFYMRMPRITGVKLKGKLEPWVSPKNVVLELLREMGVQGGLGRILEYFGPGVREIDVPGRAAICNMGTELGATSSVFPSDETTRRFLQMQGRGRAWKMLKTGGEAGYEEVVEIDLSSLEPLIALPHSPDNVVEVSEVAGRKVSQVIVGSCSGSSLQDLLLVAKVLEGRKVHRDVSLEINPGSRQALENLVLTGGLASMLRAGARINQPGCLGCIGMGQVPAQGAASLRTFPRNFKGRSGAPEDQVYLCSAEVAVAAAVEGRITDPRELGDLPHITLPEKLVIDDTLIIPPPDDPASVEVVRGPNIKPLPKLEPLGESMAGEVLLKLGDNVSTDDIMPAGASMLPLRSNIPALSEYAFSRLDAGFASRARDKGGGFVVAGENYGQGSSREHAALVPRYLGVKGVVAKSFARIHKANLVNFGILPLEFARGEDYDKVSAGSRIEIAGARGQIERGEVEIESMVDGSGIRLRLNVSDRERRIILAGGRLNTVGERG